MAHCCGVIYLIDHWVAEWKNREGIIPEES